MRLSLLATALLLLAPAPARAWWDYGHQTIASIAFAEARPSTRAAVRRLLARGRLLGTPACPVRTVVQASVWADCVKGDRRFAHTARWHYQNVHVCRPYALDCPDGACVSAQIERHARILRDKAAPERARLEALLWVVHLVGDLHMPLHAGDRGDRGGNDRRASYGLIPSSLHAIWDGHLAERAISTPPVLSRGGEGAGDVAAWSREAWEVARAEAYRDGCPGDPAPARMDEAETRRLIPIVRRQVARAAARLARLLDGALGKSTHSPRPPRSG